MNETAVSNSSGDGGVVTDVVLAEELHAHNSKDEDDDAEDQGEVAQGSDGFAHDGYEQVQRRPRLG